MSDYEKLKRIIDEIDNLMRHHVTDSAPAFRAWYADSERFIAKKYGEFSIEYSSFQSTVFRAPGLYPDIRDDIEECSNGLLTTKLIFEKYLEELQEETGSESSDKITFTYSKVFIVHGHDGELKEAVARIIEKQGIQAIILSEMANQGRTIIEKFEENSNVGGAICLFTADDIGKANKASDYKSRARQNVVFETGYFMGKLGRNHVVILADHGIEIPSDLSGVVYTNTGNWALELLKELNAMGYTVDLNKLLER